MKTTPRLRLASLSLPSLLALTVAGLVLASFVGCDAKSTQGSSAAPAAAPSASPTAVGPVAVSPATPVTYTYEVVHSYPHDPGAFTQGLIYLNGEWIESTGLNGHSSLRRVEFATGLVSKITRVPSQYFAEGMTVIGSKVYQLTWQHQKGFVYDLATFNLEKEFAYTGEGWGLTMDGKSLILSDGTNQIRFLDPATFAVTRTISVTREGQPLRLLNELEYVRGEIYANIWQSQSIARIDPATGRLLGIIDLYGLLPDAERTPETDVLNGIAYDAATDRLFVTGKRWPKIYEIKLHPKS